LAITTGTETTAAATAEAEIRKLFEEDAPPVPARTAERIHVEDQQHERSDMISDFREQTQRVGDDRGEEPSRRQRSSAPHAFTYASTVRR